MKNVNDLFNAGKFSMQEWGSALTSALVPPGEQVSFNHDTTQLNSTPINFLQNLRQEIAIDEQTDMRHRAKFN